MIKKSLVLISLVALLVGCSPSNPDELDEAQPLPPGVIVNTPPAVDDQLIPEPATTRYVNYSYGYAISYPKDCEIDLSQGPRTVLFSLDQSDGRGSVAIVVNDYEELGFGTVGEEATDEQIEGFLLSVSDSTLRDLETNYDDLLVLRNESIPNHIRVLEATHSENGLRFTFIFHFRWRHNRLFKLYGQIMGDTSDEVRAILGSFEYDSS